MFSKKWSKKCCALTPNRIVMGTVVFVLMFVLVGLSVALFTSQLASKPSTPPGLGELGATCGGPSILPCKPGLVCDVPPERWAIDEGKCIKDTRPAPTMRNEGESCGGANEQCGWGLVCTIPSGQAMGTCTSMTPEDRPFIMAVIPQGMALVQGSYRANVGTKVDVLVRATGVTGGALYLKPLTASYNGVQPKDKVSDLTPAKDAQNEYSGSFTVSKNLGAELIAVMTGTNGQEVSVPVKVQAVP
jgi:hypothetical protein